MWTLHWFGKNGTKLGIEDISLALDGMGMSNSQVNSCFPCTWKKLFLCVRGVCFVWKHFYNLTFCGCFCQRMLFLLKNHHNYPLMPLEPQLESNIRIFPVGWKRPGGSPLPTYFQHLNEQFPCYPLFGRHTGNYPPASFTDILLRRFLACFAGTHTGDSHGRGVPGDPVVSPSGEFCQHPGTWLPHSWCSGEPRSHIFQWMLLTAQ